MDGDILNYYALLAAILSPQKVDENGNPMFDKNGEPIYKINSAEDAFIAMGLTASGNIRDKEHEVD